MSRPRLLGCTSLLCAMTCCLPATAQPGSALDAAVFAGRDIQIDGFTAHTGAPIVAGNDLRLSENQVLEAQDVFLGGAFISSGGLEQITGDLSAVGDVTGLGFAAAFINGSVFSGGSVEAGAIEIGGSITASGDVSQTFSLATVAGNITSGGFVTIEGTIGSPSPITGGVVTYNTGFQLGTFASVNQLVQGGAVASPVFNSPALPTPNSITPRSNDVTLSNFQDLTLAPGSYGTLNFASSNTVTLTAGRYVFDDIVSTFALNELSFDTSGGPIELLIEGSFAWDDLVQVINGVRLNGIEDPEPADAADIWLEATGDIAIGNPWFGTVYAPNGDINVASFADVTGSLIGGRDVAFNGPADVTYVRTNVPEPASAPLLALAIAGLLRRRWAI